MSVSINTECHTNMEDDCKSELTTRESELLPEMPEIVPPSEGYAEPNAGGAFGTLSLEKVIDAVGDSGAYQRTIVITSMLCLFGAAFVAFSVSFLVAEPSFLCELKHQPGTWVECTEHFACTDPTSRAVYKFSSWAEKLGLTCDKKLLRETGKSLSLMVNALVCFLTLNLSDFVGRRTMLITNSVILLLSLALAFAATDFYLKMVMIGTAFGSQGAFSSLFIFLINEVSRKQLSDHPDPHSQLKSKISAFCLASFSLGIVALNGITLWFNSADALLAAIFVILLFLLYPNFICLEESPIWLIRQKKYTKAVYTFRKISEINDRRVPSNLFHKLLTVLESNQLQQKSESEESFKLTLKGKLKLLFFDSMYSKQLFIMCTVSSSLYCMYYGILTSVNDIGFSSIQLNGSLVGITQAGGFIIVLRFLTKTPRRKALLVIQTILLLGGFSLVCLSFSERTELVQMTEGIISTLFISTTISSLFSFMYVTNAESFPTQIRGLAVGIILLVGKLVGSCAPYVSLFSKYMKVHVLAGSSYTLFISIFATMFLRETIHSYKK